MSKGYFQNRTREEQIEAMNLHNRSLTSRLFFLCLSILVVVEEASAAQHFYDWNVSWSPRAPLGVNKQVIVINDEFPGPLLNLTTDDVVNINIHNNLTEPFLITWNGVQMRKNSWQDGVSGTNCPIQPGKNWTYSFQVKDQIGSFHYFPSLPLQKAAGGYGAIRLNNHNVVPIPFPQPDEDIDVLIGDWYNAEHWDLRGLLDKGNELPLPDGILINGLGPNKAAFQFEPGKMYRLRISNVGLKSSLNFRIQDHELYLVEIEGSYTIKQYYHSLDIHVGQSFSVLVTAKNDTNGKPYYMIASSRFTVLELYGLGTIHYPDSKGEPSTTLPSGPSPLDYTFSMDQVRSMRWDLSVGAARPNPQGSFHYGSINVSRTLVLRNDVMYDGKKLVSTINGVSFVRQDTPLKLADFFNISGVFVSGVIPDRPSKRTTSLKLITSVIDVKYRDFYQIVFQNPLPNLQTWHLDGYNLFVVGMGYGVWNENMTAIYNMIDAVSRSTVEVYPLSWTATVVMLDNLGMWNLRSQNAENWYLGQEIYLRVKGIKQDPGATISPRDEVPVPENVMRCGKAV